MPVVLMVGAVFYLNFSTLKPRCHEAETPKLGFCNSSDVQSECSVFHCKIALLSCSKGEVRTPVMGYVLSLLFIFAYPKTNRNSVF